MVESRQRVRIASLFPGHVDQLHARALGKALLAFCEPRFVAAYLAAHPPARCTDRTLVAPEAIAAELARTRRRGYAEDREEYTVGVCCIGAPIFGSADRIFGALSVSIPAFRFRAARAEARAAVLRAARAASEVLAPSDALEASDARRTQVG
jgi:DNA-binding IclR family transcriptional regulator